MRLFGRVGDHVCGVFGTRSVAISGWTDLVRWSSGRRFGPMSGAALRRAVEHGCEVEKRRHAVDVPPGKRVRDWRREERRAGRRNDLPSTFCLAMAMFTRSSGLIRWSRLSSPMSILTQAMSPLKWLSVGP